MTTKGNLVDSVPLNGVEYRCSSCFKTMYRINKDDVDVEKKAEESYNPKLLETFNNLRASVVRPKRTDSGAKYLKRFSDDLGILCSFKRHSYDLIRELDYELRVWDSQYNPKFPFFTYDSRYLSTCYFISSFFVFHKFLPKGPEEPIPLLFFPGFSELLEEFGYNDNITDFDPMFVRDYCNKDAREHTKYKRCMLLLCAILINQAHPILGPFRFRKTELLTFCSHPSDHCEFFLNNPEIDHDNEVTTLEDHILKDLEVKTYPPQTTNRLETPDSVQLEDQVPAKDETPVTDQILTIDSIDTIDSEKLKNKSKVAKARAAYAREIKNKSAKERNEKTNSKKHAKKEAATKKQQAREEMLKKKAAKQMLLALEAEQRREARKERAAKKEAEKLEAAKRKALREQAQKEQSLKEQKINDKKIKDKASRDRLMKNEAIKKEEERKKEEIEKAKKDQEVKDMAARLAAKLESLSSSKENFVKDQTLGIVAKVAAKLSASSNRRGVKRTANELSGETTKGIELGRNKRRTRQQLKSWLAHE